MKKKQVELKTGKRKTTVSRTAVRKAIKKTCKVDKGHYHEAIDRIHVIREIIETHLYNHPLFSKHKKYRKKIDKVQDILNELYQEIGSKL